jgi:hypothetical protein
MMNILNVPAYAHECRYWVVRPAEGRYWFYGAWDDRRAAERVALEIGGDVVEAE